MTWLQNFQRIMRGMSRKHKIFDCLWILWLSQSLSNTKKALIEHMAQAQELRENSEFPFDAETDPQNEAVE